MLWIVSQNVSLRRGAMQMYKKKHHYYYEAVPTYRVKAFCSKFNFSFLVYYSQWISPLGEVASDYRDFWIQLNICPWRMIVEQIHVKMHEANYRTINRNG